MVSTVRVPGRGMASTRTGRAEVGQLRLSVAVTTPLGPSGSGGRGGLASMRESQGLASPTAVNRLDQSHGWSPMWSPDHGPDYIHVDGGRAGGISSVLTQRISSPAAN